MERAMTDESRHQKTEFRPRDRALLFAAVWGPMIVLTNLTINDALVPSACDQGSKLMLHVVTAICFLTCVATAAIGRRYYNECGEADGVLSMERTRWTAIVAMSLSIASAVILIAMEIPNVMLRSCD
jgi:hypothetical protein